MSKNEEKVSGKLKDNSKQTSEKLTNKKEKEEKIMAVSMGLSRDEKKNQRRKLRNTLFKAMGAVLLAFLAAMAGVLIYANVKHRKALTAEQRYLTPPGQMVEVNGHSIHVVRREAEKTDKEVKTLVFIHSNKVTDDSIALEPLFDELSGYELIYVDRSGVGYSEDWDAPKDIDSMLEETREAVRKVTDSDKYILVAQKTGGVLAVDWAAAYPDEVEAVIGLRMYCPEQYEGMDEDEYCSFGSKVMLKLVQLGGHRLSDDVYPDNGYNLYTKDQMDTRNALIARGLYTQGMYNEDKAIVKNANKVAALGWPDKVPMYLVYSNPYMDPYLHENEDILEVYEEQAKSSEQDPADIYNNYYKDYIGKHSNVKIEEMDGPDRLIVYNPQKVADLIKEYIKGMAK